MIALSIFDSYESECVMFQGWDRNIGHVQYVPSIARVHEHTWVR